MNATISCENDILNVVEIRGAGRNAEVVAAIEARRSLEEDFVTCLESPSGPIIEGEDRVIVGRAEPQIPGAQTIRGGRTAIECPILEEITRDTKYRAIFDRRLRVFSLAEKRGVIPAGSKIFPFRVGFAPKDARPIETLMVDIYRSEICVKVCGSIGGFQGKGMGTSNALRLCLYYCYISYCFNVAYQPNR
jgi:hypothetical protein